MILALVDDHKLFRDGLKLILYGNFPDIKILEAANGMEYLNFLESTLPDITLMDINMPVLDGIETTRRAVEKYPDIKIIALTMHGDPEFYFKMLDAGIKGFLLKNSDVEELKEAIQSVISGDNYFSREILLNSIKYMRRPREAENQMIELTEREKEILELICKGYSNQEIGEKLFISKRTVDKHRANILFKTNSRNTAQLVVNAVRFNWINL